MSNILLKYNLNFEKVKILDEYRNRCSAKTENMKITLGVFFASWQDAARIQSLIDEINSVINSKISDIDTGSEMVDIEVELPNTKFYYGGNTIPDYTMPTVDFRDILIEWKKFIEK